MLNNSTKGFMGKMISLCAASPISKYSNGKDIVSSNEHHFDEVKRLKKELARVTLERDLLKKAAAYFAKDAV